MKVQEKIRLLKIVKDLSVKGYSTRKIAKITGVAKSTVSYWLQGKGLRNLNIPNLNPSSDLSYTLGVIFGDGSVFKSERHYSIVLAATSLEFVKEFNRCLCRILGKQKLYSVRERKIKKSKPRWSAIYEFRASSKLLFEFLKGKDISDFNDIIKLFPNEFIKGFADSEGCVYFRKGKKIEMTDRKIKLSNTNINLLKYIRRLLKKEFNINSYLQINSSPHLSVHGKENICRFYDNIGFTIDKKKRKLEAIVKFLHR